MSAVLDAREARARELRRAHEAPAGVASPSLSELLLEVERLESVLSERKVSSEVCSGAKGLDEQDSDTAALVSKLAELRTCVHAEKTLRRMGLSLLQTREQQRAYLQHLEKKSLAQRTMTWLTGGGRTTSNRDQHGKTGAWTGPELPRSLSLPFSQPRRADTKVFKSFSAV
mmetsp:Transcript_18857/g.49321  ORF Transcript_18857/g.49321 Transcript_18857/m.49321 type:complete len:171 (-) Transcript_18857:306-818(-)